MLMETLDEMIALANIKSFCRNALQNVYEVHVFPKLVGAVRFELGTFPTYVGTRYGNSR